MMKCRSRATRLTGRALFPARCRAGVLLAAALLVGSGCTSVPSGEYFQLQAPVAGVSAEHAETAVLLGPVKLADYLLRDTILQRQADGRLVASSGRWAGSLDDEVGQLLLRQLVSRLGNSHVALYPDRIGVHQAAQIVLGISRLDSGAEQPALLEAQWRLLDAQGEVSTSRLVTLQAEHDGSLADQVRAQGELLDQLAEQLAEAVHGIPFKVRKTGIPPANNPVVKPETTASPSGKMPVVVPAPGAQVFRF